MELSNRIFYDKIINMILLIRRENNMNKSRIIIHLVTPIMLSIMSYFISISFIFKIPAPGGGYTIETYLFAFILATFVFGISSIVSAILFVGHKRKE